MDDIGATMADMPISVSPVVASDGYKADAMLFVDEDFARTRAAREGSLTALLWKPCVRFSSNHYRYVHGPDGPLIVQVGIGADDPTGTGLNFAEPAAGEAAPPSAMPALR